MSAGRLYSRDVADRKAVCGKSGLFFSLAALASVSALWLLKPGAGSPASIIGGFAVMFGTPLGLLLGSVGLLVDGNKRPALLCLLITGLLVQLFLIVALA